MNERHLPANDPARIEERLRRLEELIAFADHAAGRDANLLHEINKSMYDLTRRLETLERRLDKMIEEGRGLEEDQSGSKRD